METWGAEAFQNDAALDWAHDIEDEEDPAALLIAFQLPKDPLVTAKAGARAIAAAELVAAAFGGTDKRLPKEIRNWLKQQRRALSTPPLRPQLLQASLSALERVLGEHSELRKQWEKDGSRETDWHKSVQALRQQLQTATMSG